MLCTFMISLAGFATHYSAIEVRSCCENPINRIVLYWAESFSRSQRILQQICWLRLHKFTLHEFVFLGLTLLCSLYLSRPWILLHHPTLSTGKPSSLKVAGSYAPSNDQQSKLFIDRVSLCDRINGVHSSQWKGIQNRELKICSVGRTHSHPADVSTHVSKRGTTILLLSLDQPLSAKSRPTI